MRLNDSAENLFPEKLVFEGWDVRDGVTVIYMREMIIKGNGLPFVPAAPQVKTKFGGVGLVQIEVDFRGSVAFIYYTFRSIKNDPVSYEYRAFTAETPIFKHLNFPEMFLWYGGGIRRGKVEWAHLDPGEPKVKKGKDGKLVFESCPNTDAKNSNPMRGIQDFLRPMVEISETREFRSRSQIPGDVLSMVGERERPEFLTSGLSGSNDGLVVAMRASLGRYSRSHWIRSGGKVVSAGSGYRVTRMWLLNIQQKWTPEIYTNRRLTAPVPE